MATATAYPFDIGLWWQRMRVAPQSLQRQCLRSIALVSAITWLIVTLALVVLAQRQAAAMFDTKLREMASLALSFANHELEEIRREGGGDVSDDVDEAFSGRLVYQVWQPGGVLAYRSGNAPAATPLHPGGGKDFADITLGAQTLRCYATWNRDQTFQIHMAAFPESLESYSASLSIALCLGLLAALLAFLLLIGHQLRHAFAPLNDTVEALGHKSVTDLSPVPVAGQPAELQPVIKAFNDLLQRMGQSMRHEQRFTSDAAHELRTPLAGLKILVRNAQRARSEQERTEALAQMGVSIDRSTALVGQLLALARHDRDAASVPLDEPVNLLTLTESVLIDLQPLLAERSVSAELLVAPSLAMVRGNREALAVVLRNLVDNAIRYSPVGGKIAIETSAAAMPAHSPPHTLQHTPQHLPQHLQWQVHDSGAGVPPDQRERIFSRFFRLDRHASSQGSGLGLALVRRIVEVHGGTVQLDESPRLQGARVTVTLRQHIEPSLHAIALRPSPQAQ